MVGFFSCKAGHKWTFGFSVPESPHELCDRSKQRVSKAVAVAFHWSFDKLNCIDEISRGSPENENHAVSRFMRGPLLSQAEIKTSFLLLS